MYTLSSVYYKVVELLYTFIQYWLVSVAVLSAILKVYEAKALLLLNQG